MGCVADAGHSLSVFADLCACLVRPAARHAKGVGIWRSTSCLPLAAEAQPARRRPQSALCEPVHLVYIRKADTSIRDRLQASAREFRLAMNANS